MMITGCISCYSFFISIQICVPLIIENKLTIHSLSTVWPNRTAINTEKIDEMISKRFSADLTHNAHAKRNVSHISKQITKTYMADRTHFRTNSLFYCTCTISDKSLKQRVCFYHFNTA